MEITFLTSSLSLLALLTISTFAYIFSKKVHIPYTVLLVIIGLFLVPLSKIEVFSFINHFELTPDILFFVFLPILLFEAAYKINFRQFVKNWKTIGILAIFGLILSASVIGGGIYFLLPFIGFDIPFLVCLLFGVLISATDPVAVLSIFKAVGAPRRLILLFEGESLFNDGTALALFLVILGIILEGGIIHSSVFGEGLISFLSMFIGGILFGTFFGVLFSKILGKIKNNEFAEITLTMVLAHLTFLLSEFTSEFISIGSFNLEISGVIATTVAGIILGNYGKFKITPKVEEHMEKFFDLFAFISNSIVFILMGLVLSHINIDFEKFIGPILLVIFVVVFARALSIYIPIGFINFFKLEENIPMSWQHLMSWGSLRGALALMMALLIPGKGDGNYDKILQFQQNVGWNFDFDIKDFILIITIGSIMFTLLIKATTITWLTKKLGIDKLNKMEEFEYDEGRILANLKILEKIKDLHKKDFLKKEEYIDLKKKYSKNLGNAVNDLKKLLKDCKKNTADTLIKKTIAIHALGIEKQFLKELFKFNEINERDFRFIFNKICKQQERVGNLEPQLRGDNKKVCLFGYCTSKIKSFIDKKNKGFIGGYVRNRTKGIITQNVIDELNYLKDSNSCFDNKYFDTTIKIYQQFHKIANEKKHKIFEKHKESIVKIEAKLIEKALLKLEEKVIKDLYNREIITPKLYIKFIEEIENEFYKNI